MVIDLINKPSIQQLLSSITAPKSVSSITPGVSSALGVSTRANISNSSPMPSFPIYSSNSSPVSSTKTGIAPVYDLTQTSIAPQYVSAASLAFTNQLYGPQQTEKAYSRIEGSSSVDMLSPLSPAAAVSSLPSLASDLGGYYTQTYPYGTYYGSTFVGGDDDYSSVAYFPIISPMPFEASYNLPYESVYHSSYSSNYVPRYGYQGYSRYSKYSYPRTGFYGYKNRRWNYAHSYNSRSSSGLSRWN